jgi:hypothetical protein
VKSNGLKRRAIRRKPGTKPPEYIIPSPKKRGNHARTADYKHFEGHIVPEVAKQLPGKTVICWETDHMISLPVCAIAKFWRQKKYCKRCSLFQGDEHSQELRSLIDKWELDEIDQEEEKT